jgi:hypothetical protein
MNEESKTQHCGDSCGAVAAMAVAFREYVPPEQRMATAIKQVLSGEMSQRGAAEANGVARKTLGDHLARLGGSAHPTKTQASTESATDPHGSPADPKATKRSWATQDKINRANAIRNEGSTETLQIEP